MITLRFSTSPGSLTCFLIRQVTWSEYSHVDICLPEGLLGAQVDGVKIRPYNYEPGARVQYMRSDVFTPEQEAAMVTFWKSQIGKPYDFGALAGILVHHDWRNMLAWFCSEYVFAPSVLVNKPFLNEIHIDRVTPGMLILSPYLKNCDPPRRLITVEHAFHAEYLEGPGRLRSQLIR